MLILICDEDEDETNNYNSPLYVGMTSAMYFVIAILLLTGVS